VLLGRLKAPTPASTHSLPALQTLRVCLFGLANRRIPRTLCDIWADIILNIFDRNEEKYNMYKNHTLGNLL